MENSFPPLTVWAPQAEQLDLLLPDQEPLPMEPVAVDGAALPGTTNDPGWWVSPLSVPSGTDYAFSVNQGPARPDPRSAWQPYGVHKWSRRYDPTAFNWEKENPGEFNWTGIPLNQAVFYELHVGTFTPSGTLDSAIERLDYLADLGITMVELMPLAAFPGLRGWGYDGAYPYAVQDSYGGPAALQRFVAAAHRRGLGVCVDTVLNHLGPEGNYTSQYGPYYTDRHHTPWGSAFDLDGPNSRPIRDYLISAGLHWLQDYRVDALRLDAVHEIKDDSPRHLLAELSDRVKELQKSTSINLSLVAESDLNDYQMVLPTQEGGKGMDAQWDDDIHHALHVAFTKETLGYYQDFAAASALKKVFEDVFYHNGTYSTFRKKFWGEPVPPDFDRRHFVSYSTNHDQTGNRAYGDRFNNRLSLAAAASSAALVLLGPYIPLVFMGEEWQSQVPFQFFTDYGDPDLAQAVFEGRQKEFASFDWHKMGDPAPDDTAADGLGIQIPHPQHLATFAASQLDWPQLESDSGKRLSRWYRKLLQLRADIPDLAAGSRPTFSATETSYTLVRGAYQIFINHSSQSCALSAGQNILAAWDQEAAAAGTVPPDCCVVLVNPA